MPDQLYNILRQISAGNLNDQSAYAAGVRDLLTLLNLAHQVEGKTQPTGEVSQFLLDLLAVHKQDELVLQFDWNNLDQDGLRGVDILAAVEQARLKTINEPTPARTVSVAQAIIKKKTATGDYYFMQYDYHGGRYQLIGGKQDPEDLHIEAALRREMSEELRLDVIPTHQEAALELLLANWRQRQRSSTYGLLTAYSFTFYFVGAFRVPLLIDDDNQWLSKEAIIHGSAADQRTITTILQDAVGWSSLDSLPATNFRP